MNHYTAIRQNHLLVLRGSVESVAGDAPFYSLPMFGTHYDLRGYVVGQYRDKTKFAVQAEYRCRLYKRWGMVGFGGIGGVAPSFSDYSKEHMLHSVGAGLRYMASVNQKVNISIDYAHGKNTYGWYFYIGEAF